MRFDFQLSYALASAPWSSGKAWQERPFSRSDVGVLNTNPALREITATTGKRVQLSHAPVAANGYSEKSLDVFASSKSGPEVCGINSALRQNTAIMGQRILRVTRARSVSRVSKVCTGGMRFQFQLSYALASAPGSSGKAWQKRPFSRSDVGVLNTNPALREITATTGKRLQLSHTPVAANGYSEKSHDVFASSRFGPEVWASTPPSDKTQQSWASGYYG
jgi:hypothetical protein